MLKSRHLFLLFIPAVLFVGAALFVRIVQYEPPFPPEEPIDTTQKPAESPVPIFPEDPITGNKKNPITLIVFSDLSCLNCVEQDALFTELETKHPGKIKIVWKLLPVTLLPKPSRPVNQYGFCANEQGKFVAFKTMAMANANTLDTATLQVISKEAKLDLNELDACLKSTRPEDYLQKTEALAKILNLQAVPVFFWNNKQIPSSVTVEGWEVVLGL